MVAPLSENVQPTVIIHEPATLVTDCLLSALSGWLAGRLRRRLPAGNDAARWWSRALGLTAVAALVGGSYHGFAPNFSPDVAGVWWVVTLMLLCLTSAAMAMSLLHAIAPHEKQRPWPGLIAFKLTAFAGVAIMHPLYLVAIIDYGLTMLALAIAAVLLRRPWSGRMLAGIGLSVVAALIQQLRLAPSPRFNHNDLYHVVQALALICFYAAGRKFTSPAPAVTPGVP